MKYSCANYNMYGAILTVNLCTGRLAAVLVLVEIQGTTTIENK